MTILRKIIRHTSKQIKWLKAIIITAAPTTKKMTGLDTKCVLYVEKKKKEKKITNHICKHIRIQNWALLFGFNARYQG